MKEPHTKRVFRCHVCAIEGGCWHKPDDEGGVLGRQADRRTGRVLHLRPLPRHHQ